MKVREGRCSGSPLLEKEEKELKKKQMGGYLQGLERRFELVESSK
jgi:hypothetical protein